MDPSTPYTPSARSTRSTPRLTPEAPMPLSPIRRSKPRKLPTVTPRRFRRFFEPRSSQDAPHSVQAPRRALGDISYSGGNRRYAQSSPIKQSRKLLDQDEDGARNIYDLTPERPSPLKRVRLTHPRDTTPDLAHCSQDIPSSPPVCPDSPYHFRPLPQPVQRSSFRKCYGTTIRREVDWPTDPTRSSRSGYCNTNWQAETAHFYSSAADYHHTYNFEARHVPRSATAVVPFCVRPCNTNSLVAISDEEGYIRLVETAAGSSPPLSTDYLHFRAHKNAILDLAFSDDDLLLATASGDQTSQVIDMRTQKALSTLWGHKSSVRQIRFQPGSGGKVLTTAGRDGLIMVWDLRCSPVEREPPASFRVDIGGGITTYDTGDAMQRYGQWVHQFTPPIPRMKGDRGVQSEKSVTALSFLDAERSYYLLSGSATSASVCLWDMRNMRLGALSGQNALVGTANPSQSVRNTRGLTSLALSGDLSRVYTLCKDSNVYAYSTSQLMSSSGQGHGQSAKALYRFQHSGLSVSTFYASLAVRPAMANEGKTELLAAGSFGNTVIFPTDEKYMRNGVVEPMWNTKHDVPTYGHGTLLVRGHHAEVSSVAWTSRGDLCTLADDYRCRVWREDAHEAKQLRMRSVVNGEDTRFCGWAEPMNDFDDEEA